MTTQQLKDTLNVQLKEAMKAKATNKLNAIRSIITNITNAEKSGKNVDPIAVLITLEKQLTESKDAFEKSGNTEMVSNLKEELEVVTQFLPKKLTDDELRLSLTELINGLEQTPTIKDMGKILNMFKEKCPGQDGAKAASLVKEFLNK